MSEPIEATISEGMQEFIEHIDRSFRRLRRSLRRAGFIPRPASRYRQTRRGRVATLLPVTRATQQIIRARGGRR